MEKNEQQAANAAKKSKWEEYYTFIGLPLFIISHFAWMMAMSVGNQWLISITQPILVVLIGVSVICLACYYMRGKLHFGNLVSRHTEHPVIARYCQLMIHLYMGTLTGTAIVACFVPENMGWILSLVPLLGIFVIIAATIHFYKLYREDRPELLDSKLDVRVWEKYWAYLMVSGSMLIWLGIALSAHLLYHGLALVVNDALYAILSQLHTFVWLMLPLVMVYELSKLSRHHAVVIKSQPIRGHRMQTLLGAEGLVALLLVPILRGCIYGTLSLPVADTVYLVVCLVLALVILATTIYYWVCKSKYLKASTLSW